MTLVFVYGTLKRGLSNHHFLKGQAFVGAARTQRGYVLYELDGYPGMVPDPVCTEGVGGEVWAVDDSCLAQLDALEGTDEGLYARKAVTMTGAFHGRTVDAYFYLGDLKDRRRVGAEWP